MNYNKPINTSNDENLSESYPNERVQNVEIGGETIKTSQEMEESK
jgi:hypothetical protein